MADQKISEITTTAVVGDTDRFVVSVDPTGSPVTRAVAATDALRLAEGELSVAGASTAQALTTSLAKLTAWTAAVSGVNVTADAANDLITLDNAGVYYADVVVAFTAVSAITYTFQAFWNGAAVGVPVAVKANDTAGQIVSFTVRINASSAAADLDLRAKVSSANNITVTDATMTVRRYR